MIFNFFRTRVVQRGRVLSTLAHLATVAVLCGNGVQAAQPLQIVEGQLQNSRYEALSYATGISWNEASANCQARGGRLADILSVEENQFITTQLLGKITPWKAPYRGAWIGYTDAQKEGSWIWTSGRSSSYKNFGAGEPNNSGGIENCGAIELQRNASQPNGLWNDYSCYGTSSYGVALCEYDIPCQPATYEAATGVVNIPVLNIEGLPKPYQGKLKQAAVSFFFSVFGGITPSTVLSSCPATYSATTGKLLIPVVKAPNPMLTQQNQCYNIGMTQFYNSFELDSIKVISCP